mmetsp:Transcript_46819/g.114057  ORF Transcript_46819/g.114057 Transcript_46819/m.114057 type:complete len:464 (-) Transcript_46819:148-1539(-)|eukprot:CAMPEP_0206232468 /NCGR_PEP_ID=MMETSP0047_2-20121206/11431_1 /ASSEMBLY_ACC=CAM_ASM_000192 /TAXON_ID=195065 /ORGANISM="Chroomonas mesostigmatica_cf, Strain CCMP1168" /LENGTH=463 /DNA_ID=CAMNT_0053656205 /DNA_START=173 /DNA_END=1564 /DNA_ORIENTATION=+
MSSAALPSLSCTSSPPQDGEKYAVLALGIVAVMIVAYDVLALRKRVWYLFNFRSRWTALLIVPGLYAVLNVLSVFMRTSNAKLVMADIQGVLRAWYLYESVTINFSYFSFNEGGVGSTDEAVERVGRMLEEMNLPLQKAVAPPFFLCWGTRWVQPGRKFLRSCVLRMHIAIIFNVLVLIIRPIVWDYGVASPTAVLGMWDTGNIYLIFFGLMTVGIGYSAKFPLEGLLTPFVLGHSVSAMKLRKLQGFLIFAVMGGIQGIIALITTYIPSPCYWWVFHQQIFVAIELIVIVLIGHRVWLPPFHWGVGRSDHHHAMKAMIAAANSTTGTYESALRSIQSTTSITVHREDIARVMNGEKSIHDARKEASDHLRAIFQLARITSGKQPLHEIVVQPPMPVHNMAEPELVQPRPEAPAPEASTERRGSGGEEAVEGSAGPHSVSLRLPPQRMGEDVTSTIVFDNSAA